MKKATNQYEPLWDGTKHKPLSVHFGKKAFAPAKGEETQTFENAIFLKAEDEGSFDGQTPEQLLMKVIEVMGKVESYVLHRWSFPSFCMESAKAYLQALKDKKAPPEHIRLEVIAKVFRRGQHATPQLICWDTSKAKEKASRPKATPTSQRM